MTNDRVSLENVGSKGKICAKKRSNVLINGKTVKAAVCLCAVVALMCLAENKARAQATHYIDHNHFINNYLFDPASYVGHVGAIAMEGQLDNRRIRLETGTGSIRAGVDGGTMGTQQGVTGTPRFENYYETRVEPGTGGANEPPANIQWRYRPDLQWGDQGHPNPGNAWQDGGPYLPAGYYYPDPLHSSHWAAGGLPGSPLYDDGNSVIITRGPVTGIPYRAGGPRMGRYGSRSTITFGGYNAGDDSGGVIFNAGTYSITGEAGSAVWFSRPSLVFTENRWQYNYASSGTSMQYSRVFFVDNRAASGGAIDNVGTLTLTRVTFNDNVATGGTGTAAGFGGAISNVLGGMLILDDVSFGGAIPLAGAYTIPRYPSMGGGPLSGSVLVNPPADVAVQVAPDYTQQFTNRGNTAHFGGAIYNLYIVEGNENAQNYVNFLSGFTNNPGIIFANNLAHVSGGAIFNDQGGIIRASANTPGAPGRPAQAGHADGLFRGTFEANSANLFGGAIFNNAGGTVSIRGSFTDNWVTGLTPHGDGVGYGGAIYNVAGGTVTLDGVVLQGNVAGGVHATATLSLTGLGGAVYSEGTLNLGLTGTNEVVTFSNNRAWDGGGIYSLGGINSNASVYLSRNEAGNDGGGLYNLGRGVTFAEATFMMNTAERDGGAFFNLLGEITLDSVRFSGNRAGNEGEGGAIANSWGTVILGGAASGVSFTDNYAGTRGGALYNDNGIVRLRESSFTRNTTSTGDGGAIYNEAGTITVRMTEGGDLTWSDITFTSNRAEGGSGGAIYNARAGEIEFANTTFATSYANVSGGAIYNEEDATIRLTNTSFTQSTANTGYGGAIFNKYSGTIIISRNSVEGPGRIGGSFTGSTAGISGGAIYNEGRANAPGGAVSLSDVEFYFSTAGAEDGGAIYNGLNAVLRINDPTDSNSTRTAGFQNMFTDNKALTETATLIAAPATYQGIPTEALYHGRGGAIFNDGAGVLPWEDIGEMHLFNVRFLRNEARFGGAIFNLGTLLINNTELGSDVISFANNKALEWNDSGTIFGGDGGAIYNDIFGQLTLERGSFLQNYATNRGGAIYNALNAALDITAALAQDSLTLSEGSFVSNRTGSEGGAIYNAGNLKLTGLASGNEPTFSLNEAGVTVSLTGAITITAAGKGGAIFNAAKAELTLTDVSFENNRAHDYLGTAGLGGAIYNEGENKVFLNVHNRNSTFGLTDDVFFGGGGTDPHLFSVEINAGRTLTMSGGMGSNNAADVTIKQIGGGTWIIENKSAIFDAAGTVDFEVYQGTLDIRRSVVLDLGGGTFRLYGAGETYERGDGITAGITAPGEEARLIADHDTWIHASVFTFDKDTVLEFNTRNAVANNTFLNLVHTGTPGSTVDISEVASVLIDLPNIAMIGTSTIVLIDLGTTATFINTTIPTGWLRQRDGTPGGSPMPPFVRGQLREDGLPEFFYGLGYRPASGLDTDPDNQLVLGVADSMANARLHWTGVANSTWNAGVTSAENWRGVILGSTINTFLHGDWVTFADNDGADPPVNVDADRRTVRLVEDIRVGDTRVDGTGDVFNVTGTDYEFDLNGHNLRASNLDAANVEGHYADPDAGQNINFGSAIVKAAGSTITAWDITFGANSTFDAHQGNAEIRASNAFRMDSGSSFNIGFDTKITADTITFASGNTLEFNMSGAGNGDTFLTITSNDPVGNHLDDVHIRLSSLPTGPGLADGDRIVLVEVTNNNFNRTLLGHNFYVGDSTSIYAPNRSAWDYTLAMNSGNLILEITQGFDTPTTLYWTGVITHNDNGITKGTWDVGATENWREAPGGFTSTVFLNNDHVVFDNTATAGVKHVSIVSPVTVNTMTVSDSSYVFDFVVGTGTITATSTIDLGNATLNIVGYEPETRGDNGGVDYDVARHEQEVISAGGDISNFNSAIRVLGQVGENPDFLSASARQKDANTIVVETRLTWESTDPDRKAHGDFTITNGNTFTLGAQLATNTDDNRRDGWDGNSLTKKGGGTLILTENNIYTGATRVEQGTLEINNGGSIAGGLVTVSNDGALLNVLDGRVGGNVTLVGGYDDVDSEGNFIRTVVGGELFVAANSTVAGTVDATRLSDITVAGRVDGNVNAGERSMVNVFGDGQIAGNVTSGRGTTVNVSGNSKIGTFDSGGSPVSGGNITANEATVNVNIGGQVGGNITAYAGSDVHVVGRVHGDVDVYGTGSDGKRTQLFGTGTIEGEVTVGTGATLSAGTVGTRGDFHVGELTMEGQSWLWVDFSGIEADLIYVANTARFDDTITIHALNIPNPDRAYEIVRAGTIEIIGDIANIVVESGVTGSDIHETVIVRRGGLEPDEYENSLYLQFDFHNATIYWNGTHAVNGDVWKNDRNEQDSAARLRNWQDHLDRPTYFINGDTVFFDSRAENKDVDVHYESVTVGGVTAGMHVAGMTVEVTGYTFALTAGANAAIHSTGHINLNDAALKISGFNPGFDPASSPFNPNDQYNQYTERTLIRAEGTLTWLGTPGDVEVSGQVGGGNVNGTDRYLHAQAWQEGNEIKVATWLSWYSRDENYRPHGTFRVEDDTFTLGAGLHRITLDDYPETWAVLDQGYWNGNSLTKTGSGTLILTAENTYTGVTQVNEGTLQIGDGGTTGSISDSLGIELANNANVTFNRSNPYTYANVISGNGTVTQNGTGRLILTGNNTYTGTTYVNAGTLQIGDGGTTGSIGHNGGNNTGTGAIVNNANVEFNRSDLSSTPYIYNGIISGTGRVTQAGTGTTVLNGIHTYTGGTYVDNGTLYIGNTSTGNSIFGPVFVESGAYFGGSGNVQGTVTLADGASLAPGNSVGHFTVSGDVNFRDNSIYLYEISGLNHDLLTVAGGGVIKFEGDAFLQVELLGQAVPGTPYQVIALDDNNVNRFEFTGTNPEGFELIGSAGSMFRLEFARDTSKYSSVGLWLDWNRFANIIGDPYGTTNAGRAARGMDSIIDEGIPFLPDSMLFQFFALNNSELLQAFRQLHGEVFATNRETAMLTQRRFQQLMPTGQDFVMKPETIAERPKLWSKWGTVVGTFNTRTDIGTYSGYELSTAGFAAGMDRRIIPNMLIGVALGYDNVNTSFNTIRSKSKTDSLRSMVHVSWFNGKFYIDGYGGYTKNWHNTTRNIDIAFAPQDVFSVAAKGKYDDDLISTGVDFGRVLWLNDATTVAPGAGFHYARLIAPSITETGGNLMNLHVAGGHYQSFRASLGAKASRIFTLTDNVVLTPDIRGYYIREFADDEAIVRTSFNDVREITFNAHSGKWGPDSGRLGMGLGLLVSDWLTFRLDYDREIYNHTNMDTFSTSAEITW